ncbi:MAG: ThuA domain-containing protein [Planctomycetaceae bacterium]|nr:ThuA domain-containing protein [Planctomycetaceae bacterium]
MAANRCVTTALFMLGFCALVALPAAQSSAGEAAKESARILLITGEDYPGHKWKETYPVVKAELEKDPRLTVDVLTDLKSLATVRLSDYDAAVLHFKNYDPEVPGRKGFDNLAGFVEQGGGLTILHFGCGAFEEFKDDFTRLAGRVWFGAKTPPGRRGHDPHGEFTVNTAKVDHPIVKGMEDFTTVDELYSCLEGETPITVLATAVSKVDHKVYPMVFVLQYGKGRVFHSVLGHDTAAFAAEGPAELHRRGCAWTAGLEPGPRK